MIGWEKREDFFGKLVSVQRTEGNESVSNEKTWGKSSRQREEQMQKMGWEYTWCVCQAREMEHGQGNGDWQEVRSERPCRARSCATLWGPCEALVRVLDFIMCKIESYMRVLSGRVTWAVSSFEKDHSSYSVENRLVGIRARSKETGERMAVIM